LTLWIIQSPFKQHQGKLRKGFPWDAVFGKRFPITVPPVGKVIGKSFQQKTASFLTAGQATDIIFGFEGRKSP